MKNLLKRHSVFFGITIVLVIVSLIAGCDNDSDNTKPPDNQTGITVEVRINSSTNKVLRGSEVTFLAAVRGETTDKTVEWSIDENEEKHQETKLYINEEGVVCLFVSEDETLETLTIRATSNADPEKSGKVVVDIPTPTVDKVEISLAEPWVVPWQGIVDVDKGGAIEFTVKVTGNDFIREAVTWSIDNEDKKQGTVIIDYDNGVAQLSVALDETLTSFKVQAVSKWDASKIGEVSVTVKKPTVKGVVILDHEGIEVPDGSKNPKKIKASDSESFRAVVTGTGKVDQNVTWNIERLTYIVTIDDVRPNNDGDFTNGWGSTDLEIDLEDDTAEVYTWIATGRETSIGTSICEKKPIERIPGSKEVKFWFINENLQNEQKTLVPITGGTKIDENGKFTVDGQETFGKFRLTAVSTADPTMKKVVVVQIDTSSDINIDLPEV